jgi:hypothetical protein
MCHEHSDRDISAIVLSVATQKVFRLLIRGDLDAFLRLNVSEPVLRELETVLTAFITHQLERDLNSLKVMRRVGESLPAWDDYRSTK